MTAVLPINAIFSGIQTDGFWAGTPTLIIQVMDHRGASIAPTEALDGTTLLPAWDLDEANEVSIDKLLQRRGNSSPHFTRIGVPRMSALALSYHERHVLLVGRELGLHDVAPFAAQLLASGRSVQIETTVMSPNLAVPKAWVTLITLPSRSGPVAAGMTEFPDEALACVRWRTDLDRAEATFANRKLPVFLRPSAYAEGGIYRQCIAIASRHAGWRVVTPQQRAFG